MDDRPRQELLPAGRGPEAAEASWQQVQALRKKAKAMLALPLATTTVSDDGMMITVTPTNWTLRDAVAMTELAAQLEAAALAAAAKDPAEMGDVPIPDVVSGKLAALMSY